MSEGLTLDQNVFIIIIKNTNKQLKYKMRFGFYTSLSLGAILATESRMALAQEHDEELMLSEM